MKETEDRSPIAKMDAEHARFVLSPDFVRCRSTEIYLSDASVFISIDWLEDNVAVTIAMDAKVTENRKELYQTAFQIIKNVVGQKKKLHQMVLQRIKNLCTRKSPEKTKISLKCLSFDAEVLTCWHSIHDRNRKRPSTPCPHSTNMGVKALMGDRSLVSALCHEPEDALVKLLEKKSFKVQLRASTKPDNTLLQRLLHLHAS